MSASAHVKSFPGTPIISPVRPIPSISLPTTPALKESKYNRIIDVNISSKRTPLTFKLDGDQESESANSAVVATALEILDKYSLNEASNIEKGTLSTGFYDLNIQSPKYNVKNVSRKLDFTNSHSTEFNKSGGNLETCLISQSEGSLNLQENFSSEDFPSTTPSWVNSEKSSHDDTCNSVINVCSPIERLEGGTDESTSRTKSGADYFSGSFQQSGLSENQFYTDIGSQINSIMKLSKQYEVLLNNKAENQEYCGLQHHLEEEQLKRKKCEERLVQLEIKLLHSEKKALRSIEKVKAGGLLVSKLQNHCKVIATSWDQYSQKFILEKTKLIQELQATRNELLNLEKKVGCLTLQLNESMAKNADIERNKQLGDQQLYQIKTEFDKLKCSYCQLETNNSQLMRDYDENKKEKDFLESSILDVGLKSSLKT